MGRTLPSPSGIWVVVWCSGVPGRQHMDPSVLCHPIASPSSEQRCLRNSSFLSLVGKADFPLRIVTRAVSLLMLA